MKTKKLEGIVNDEGRCYKNGKLIKAKPIGSPVALPLGGYWFEQKNKIISEALLHRHKPDGANAYTQGGDLYGNTIAVQYYRI